MSPGPECHLTREDSSFEERERSVLCARGREEGRRCHGFLHNRFHGHRQPEHWKMESHSSPQTQPGRLRPRSLVDATPPRVFRREKIAFL